MRRLPLLLVVCLAACTAEVEGGLTSSQANELVTALDQNGIGARKEADDARGQDRTYRVMVARGDVPSALAALSSLELPREPMSGYEEVFERSSLVPSATEERARHAAAVSGELARSLESLNGVTRARVHVALPDPSRRPLDDQPARPRASVLVQHTADSEPSERAIRDLLIGAVDGLDASNITVVQEERLPIHPAPAQLAFVGPIAVSRGTASLLKAVLAGSFALNLLLIAALLFQRRRGRDAGSPAGDTAEVEP